ncbi:hypothetical protein RJ641_004863 [Dillenia turbinata]|uniref:Uncharacterized protein n=1 Tax=Dillenia turbinata TaxID=194707 RepID=A0AAN8V591_9MAGN
MQLEGVAVPMARIVAGPFVLCKFLIFCTDVDSAISLLLAPTPTPTPSTPEQGAIIKNKNRHSRTTSRMRGKKQMIMIWAKVEVALRSEEASFSSPLGPFPSWEPSQRKRGGAFSTSKVASLRMNTVQYKGFDCDTRTKPEEDSPFESFPGGWLPFSHRLLPHLV